MLQLIYLKYYFLSADQQTVCKRVVDMNEKNRQIL